MGFARPQVVVISGASAGIGAATAFEFAKNKHHLVLGARRVDRLELMRKDLLAAGAASVQIAALDVRDESSIKEFVAAVTKHHPQVDILINNAGMAKGTDPTVSGKTEDWRLMIDTNIWGALLFIRAFLPGMLSKNSGHIINMGSVAGHYVYVGGAVYAATKHALRAVSETLRLELNGTPIRVSSIDPGMVETEFSEVRWEDKSKAKAVYKGMTPLTAEDIAECIYFAASRPTHVNIDKIVLYPTDQASVYKVHRRE
jgi:NADP-dependent 3-hydroxy acid dehydrogenase YdfG